MSDEIWVVVRVEFPDLWVERVFYEPKAADAYVETQKKIDYAVGDEYEYRVRKFVAAPQKETTA